MELLFPYSLPTKIIMQQPSELADQRASPVDELLSIWFFGKKMKTKKKSENKVNLFIIRLNYLFVLIFVVFVVNGFHFHRMFKMVFIFTECLEWSSFS